VLLPTDFPHTRREQYLAVLPSALLTRAELVEVLACTARLRWHLDHAIAMALVDMAAGGRQSDWGDVR
jgi:hypothetical protein